MTKQYPTRADRGESRGVDATGVEVNLCAVIVSVARHEVPRVLTVSRSVYEPELSTVSHSSSESIADSVGPPLHVEEVLALPHGPLNPSVDVTLERALLRWVREQTGLELEWIEQLYTFGDQYRHPGEIGGRPRAISVAYLVLVRDDAMPAQAEARWQEIYTAFPWEDWRGGRPGILDEEIIPATRGMDL